MFEELTKEKKSEVCMKGYQEEKYQAFWFAHLGRYHPNTY